MNKCPLPPTEVFETYGKAGEIFANKFISLFGDKIIDNLAVEYPDTQSILKYKFEFGMAMMMATDVRDGGRRSSPLDEIDSDGYDTIKEFYGKINNGLKNKFPALENEQEIYAEEKFWEISWNRFSKYFDENKKYIAHRIIGVRQKQFGDRIDKLVDNLVARLLDHPGPLGDISTDYPLQRIAYAAGQSVADQLLFGSGEMILNQAQASASDVETQKRYFVDTLSAWDKGDNDYIRDSSAWDIYDDYYDVIDKVATIKREGNGDAYVDDFDSGLRARLSSYFNKKTGATSGVPPVSRTPFLLSKKAVGGIANDDLKLDFLAYLAEQENGAGGMVHSNMSMKDIAEEAGRHSAMQLALVIGKPFLAKMAKENVDVDRQRQMFVSMLDRLFDGDDSMAEFDQDRLELVWESYSNYYGTFNRIADTTAIKEKYDDDYFERIFDAKAKQVLSSYFNKFKYLEKKGHKIPSIDQVQTRIEWNTRFDNSPESELLGNDFDDAVLNDRDKWEKYALKQGWDAEAIDILLGDA